MSYTCWCPHPCMQSFPSLVLLGLPGGAHAFVCLGAYMAAPCFPVSGDVGDLERQTTPVGLLAIHVRALDVVARTRYEKEQARTRYRSGPIVRGQVRSTQRPKGGMQADRGAQGVKTRSDIGSQQGQHRQSLHTKAAMTQRDGKSHTRDYTGSGSRPCILFNPVLAGHPEDIVYHYVNSGITVADIAAPSISEPNSAQRAPDGRCRQGEQGEHYSTAVG
jgi:hypothetical protein